jgi:adenosylcobinamide kinase / adenosylcobinamide-phosphate guanylyltransferase
MCKHEEKDCPRCQAAFECKVGDIIQCQCYGIGLTIEERAFVEERFEDCLCRNCLLELKRLAGSAAAAHALAAHASAVSSAGATVIFITGGTRSGKSSYAQGLALRLSANPVYVATARRWDEEFQRRIDRHQLDRDERWTSLEEEKNLGQLDLAGKVAVIDCVTLWITNFFVDTQNDIEASLDACKKEIDQLCRQDATLIIVSNEIGMGIHAETEVGRRFADLQGWVNQYIAGKAAKVVLMVSGIPVTIKGVIA